MYIGIHVKYPLFLCEFERNLISLDGFSKSTNLMRILPGGAKLLHEEKGTDGQTYKHEEVNIRFSQFGERA
jgi:hypothetical protein